MFPTSAHGPSTKSEYVKHMTNITGVPVLKEPEANIILQNQQESIWVTIKDIHLLTLKNHILRLSTWFMFQYSRGNIQMGTSVPYCYFPKTWQTQHKNRHIRPFLFLGCNDTVVM